MRLVFDAEPTWLDLPAGPRVLSRPFDTLISQAAFAEAAAVVAPLQAEAEEARAAGTPLDPTGRNGANAAWVSARQWVALIEATARYAVLEWRGINGADGEPLAVTPEALAAFARHPDLGPQWYVAYKAPGDAIDAEGNGSATSAAGDGAATATTAEAVPTPRNGRARAAATA